MSMSYISVNKLCDKINIFTVYLLFVLLRQGHIYHHKKHFHSMKEMNKNINKDQLSIFKADVTTRTEQV